MDNVDADWSDGKSSALEIDDPMLEEDASIELITSRADSTPVFSQSCVPQSVYMDSYNYLREDGRYLHISPEDLAMVGLLLNFSQKWKVVFSVYNMYLKPVNYFESCEIIPFFVFWNYRI